MTDDTTTQHFGRPVDKPAKSKGGRPSTYSPEIAQRICEHIATGGYATNLKRFGLPHESTVCDWQNKIPEFAEAYARARERRAETFADQMVEIADTCEDPAKGRLQIDTRKWIASKLLPRVYGENQRVEVQHTISETAARVLSELSQRQKDRKRLEARTIDVTPEHSPREGVIAERNALTSLTIDDDSTGTARVMHSEAGADADKQPASDPPPTPTTGAPPLQQQPPRLTRKPRKK